MRFHEYPKALYQGGDASQAYAVAAVPAEEVALRAQGFRMIGEAESEPGPSPASQPEEAVSTPDEEPSQPESEPEPTVESVRAQLDAQGIAYDGRWGLTKLQSLLPTTEA